MTPESSAIPGPEESSQVASAAEDTSTAVVMQLPEEQSSDSVRASVAGLAMRLPLQLDLRVPLPSFRVLNLLSLEKGQIIESAWPHTEDLPLWSGDVHLVWAEFEVVDQKLAVRVTRLV